MIRRRTVTLVALTCAAVTACSSPGSQPAPTPAPERPATGSAAGPSPSGTPGARPSPGTEPTTVPDGGTPDAEDPAAGWSLERKVGQLLMVGTPAEAATVGDATRTAIEEHHVGNVFLHGRSGAGVEAARALVESATGLARDADATPMLVATDQEGGSVQVLRGPGFSELPPATEQATWDPDRLEDEATAWGAELADAGINLNLAPVMDLVPADNQSANAPIGYFSRNYGNTARSVVRSATAFSAGMQASGVEPVIKHFPGLGYVSQNTDTTERVTDDTVTADSASVEVFAEGIDAGARFVMLSNAVYTRIDPENPATFSPAVVDLLRDELGFDGVVVTDDVSAAAAVENLAPAERAVEAVDAGADLILASADPTVVPAMAEALVARAEEDREFAATVDAAVGRVLAAKAELRG
ncbi:glycoside hydrolase family 3 protein [Isoptericola sp. S6320L]|uniref:glycoside hydrolase family 3 N-terminal domain-containing protein n=1 Tax=Isoptericola sp. S6320L TaxID=2926411 RepID=UPI001FF46AF0|nr:glycoside hydrolase family 3 N-terminal domain-containing protein [Isoptericola sp. S6320L]MCK0118422.1 glycoside hydrolase family 3 protein [Isoptericola sp. S6320L]